MCAFVDIWEYIFYFVLNFVTSIDNGPELHLLTAKVEGEFNFLDG